MKRLKPEVGIKNVIKIDGKNMKKAAWTRRVHGVTRVIRVRPRVGPEKLFHSHAQKYFIQRKNILLHYSAPVRQRSISEEIQYFFVRIILTAKEDEVL